MSDRPKLAICIPAYNRAAYIGETLQSIIDEGRPDVEVVVSDNASTDATGEVVQSFASRLPLLRYVRQPVNLGADRNYLEVVRHGTAEYCWLMGSDDRVARGALASMLEAVSSDVDVVIADRDNWNLDMTRHEGVEHFMTARDGEVFDCAVPGQLEAYLRAVTGIGGVFAYISVIAVRKDAWDAVADREEFIGSAYVHTAKLLDVLRTGGRLMYLAKPVVMNRTGNDSFATHGASRRRRIDFNYVQLANGVFRDDAGPREALLRVIERQCFSISAMLSDKRFAVREGPGGMATLASGYVQLRGRRGYRRKMLIWRWAPVRALDMAHAAIQFARSMMAPLRRRSGPSRRR